MLLTKVIYLLKCCNPKQISDFGLISILRILSKVIEKLIKADLLIFRFDHNKIIEYVHFLTNEKLTKINIRIVWFNIFMLTHPLRTQKSDCYSHFIISANDLGWVFFSVCRKKKFAYSKNILKWQKLKTFTLSEIISLLLVWKYIQLTKINKNI